MFFLFVISVHVYFENVSGLKMHVHFRAYSFLYNFTIYIHFKNWWFSSLFYCKICCFDNSACYYKYLRLKGLNTKSFSFSQHKKFGILEYMQTLIHTTTPKKHMRSVRVRLSYRIRIISYHVKNVPYRKRIVLFRARNVSYRIRNLTYEKVSWWPYRIVQSV